MVLFWSRIDEGLIGKFAFDSKFECKMDRSVPSETFWVLLRVPNEVSFEGHMSFPDP